MNKDRGRISERSWLRKLSRSISPYSKKRKLAAGVDMMEEDDTSKGCTRTETEEQKQPTIRRKKKILTSATTSIAEEDGINITCFWDKDKRNIHVTRQISVSSLLNAIRKEYNAPVCIGEIKFEDEDKDLITISKTTDLEVCFGQENREIFVIKQDPTHIRARSAPDEFLSSHLSQNLFTEEEKEKDEEHSCQPLQTVQSGNIKIQNHRSLPSRKYSIGNEDDTKFRRTKTSDAPWCGAVINPLDLVIPEHIRPLGRGFFGEVRVGYLHGQKVACKILFGKSFKNKTENDLFMREISILSELRHPNIITYLGTCIEQNRKMIVMEFMEYGCLHEYIFSEIPDFGNLLNIVRDVAIGMQFLHDNKILHRDFNSKNILLSSGMIAKVADFGLSRKKLENTNLSYTMGQIPWMAPEVISYSKNYTHKSDVYSFGVLLWEIVARQSPCPPALSYISMANKVLTEQWRPQIPVGVPEDWVRLLEACWAQNAVFRPSFTEILKSVTIMGSNYFSSPSTPQFPSLEKGLTKRANSMVFTSLPRTPSQASLASFFQTPSTTIPEDYMMSDIADLAKRYEEVELF